MPHTYVHIYTHFGLFPTDMGDVSLEGICEAPLYNDFAMEAS